MTPAHIQRLTQAGEWLLRLNDAARTEQDINDWLAWCDTNPENLQAFEHIQGDWQDLDALKSPVLPLAPVRRESARVRGLSRLPSRSWPMAAVLAAVTVTASVFYYLHTRNPVRQLTASTANKSVTLPDGSSIVLGARTRLDVDFSGAARKLELSPGEAYFKVSRDKQRPFVVHSGEVSVTALGTAFNIRRNPDRIVVTVEEGAVQFSAPGGESSTWRAQAGYQLTYSVAHRTATLAAVNPAAFLKWRNGELAYDAETLGNVIADVNRYSSRRIFLKDLAQSALPFTGTVFVNAIDDWLTAIQDAYSLRVEYLPGGDISLSPAPTDG